MASDGSIILETKVDESGLSSGLSKIKSGASKTGKALLAVGAAATAAFTAVSVSAIKSYADYEQLTGGVETLFKKSSDTVMDYANQAYQTAGMSANMYMETVTSFSASLLQSLGGDTAKAAEYGNRAVIDMSDNANKMGTDIQRIQDAYQGFAKQNFTMLDNLKLGYGGTKTEMERLLQDAENIKKANGEMADYSIDSFADITEAIHVVQENMGITGTTAEEAATTIRGSANMVKASWENLVTGMADENADVEKLMEEFADSVITLFKNLEPVVEETLGNLPKFVSKLGTKVIKAIPQVFNAIAPKVLESITTLISTIVNTIAKNGKTIGSTIANMTGTIVSAVISLVPQMASAGVKLITGLIQGLQSQYPLLTTAVMTITSIFTALKVVEIAQGIVSSFQTISVVLQGYTTACAMSQSVSLLLASTMTPLQLAVGVLTGQVTLATAAQTAWNAVMNLNPAILITTAIVGLTVAVAGAVTAYDSYIEKTSEGVQAAQVMAAASAEAAQKAQEQADKMASLGESAAQSIEDAEAEAYANSILADELYLLAEQTDLTATQKERMKEIVEELNGNISGLNLQLDEETGQLNMTKDALDEYITKSLEVAKAKAVQELYTESLKEQYKAQANMKKAAEEYTGAQERLNEFMVNGMDYQRSYAAQGLENRKQMAALKETIDNATNSYNTNATACQTSQNTLKGIAEAAGVELPQGFQIALEEFDGMAQGMIDKCQEASNQSSGLGSDFGTGYANGISSQNSVVYQKAYELARQALQGVRDAQDSASPAKETIKLGDYFDEGYIIGIENGLRDAEKSGEKLAKSALKGAKSITKNAAVEISNSLKSLTDDTRSEVQKVFDEWDNDEKNILYHEKRYAEESARIAREREEKEFRDKLDDVEKDYQADIQKAKNSKEIQEAETKREEKLAEIHNEKMEKEQREAEDNYLDRLKETADKTRQIYEARIKESENLKNKIIDTYNEMASKSLSAIEDLEKTQETFSKKLKNYGDIYNERQIKNLSGTKTYKWLADIGETNKELENYYQTLIKVKERGDVPAEFFENLRDMGVEEGLEYAQNLLKLNDKQWDKYINDWKEKQALSEKIAKELYKDDVAALAVEINDGFKEVEEEFFGVGGTAANNFGDGFLAQLSEVVSDIKATINSAFSSIALPIPAYSTSPETQNEIFKIPALARGAVIPANKEFLAVLGDQRQGTNIEAPAELIKKMAKEAYQEMGLTGAQQQVVREEHYNLNQTELMTIIYKLVKGGERLNGISLVEGGTY